MPREKSRYRTRSPSYGSDSSYDKKRSKTKSKRRSRDRSESSQRRRRSTSRSRKRRSYSRSDSPDRYKSSSRRRSLSHSKKSSRRSVSKDRSRSSSRSRSKYNKKSRSRRRSRSSSSRSSSFEIEKPIVQKKVNLDDTEAKLEKAIKAAAAAGLSMTKIPTYQYKEVDVKEDMPTIHDRNLLAELNCDSFVPKSFTSSKSKKQNIVIDLNTNTVKVPEADIKTLSDDSVIDFSKIPDEAELKEMWIRKLYLYRKKMLKGEI